jgi:hypothetical protein
MSMMPISADKIKLPVRTTHRRILNDQLEGPRYWTYFAHNNVALAYGRQRCTTCRLWHMLWGVYPTDHRPIRMRQDGPMRQSGVFVLPEDEVKPLLARAAQAVWELPKYKSTTKYWWHPGHTAAEGQFQARFRLHNGSSTQGPDITVQFENQQVWWICAVITAGTAVARYSAISRHGAQILRLSHDRSILDYIHDGPPMPPRDVETYEQWQYVADPLANVQYHGDYKYRLETDMAHPRNIHLFRARIAETAAAQDLEQEYRILSIYDGMLYRHCSPQGGSSYLRLADTLY